MRARQSAKCRCRVKDKSRVFSSGVLDSTKCGKCCRLRSKAFDSSDASLKEVQMEWTIRDKKDDGSHFKSALAAAQRLRSISTEALEGPPGKYPGTNDV